MRKITVTENMIPIDRKCVEQGIGRKELSQRSGVPIRTLESWSRRINIPRDVYQLYKVAKVLGCQIEDLIEPEVAEQAKAAKAAAESAMDGGTASAT